MGNVAPESHAIAGAWGSHWPSDRGTSPNMATMSEAHRAKWKGSAVVGGQAAWAPALGRLAPCLHREGKFNRWKGGGNVRRV